METSMCVNAFVQQSKAADRGEECTRMVLGACVHGTALSAAASVPSMLHATNSCCGELSNTVLLLGTGRFTLSLEAACA